MWYIICKLSQSIVYTYNVCLLKLLGTRTYNIYNIPQSEPKKKKKHTQDRRLYTRRVKSIIHNEDATSRGYACVDYIIYKDSFSYIMYLFLYNIISITTYIRRENEKTNCPSPPRDDDHFFHTTRGHIYKNIVTHELPVVNLLPSPPSRPATKIRKTHKTNIQV